MKFLLAILILPIVLFASSPNAVTDKKEFYDIVSSNDKSKVENLLKKLDAGQLKEKEAYQGTLLMIMAGIVVSPYEKLTLFKEGAVKLDKVINQNSNVPEYRFLRLIIQENAPGFLGYNDKIDEDKRIIKASFQSMDPDVKNAILDYCKQSKVISTKDF